MDVTFMKENEESFTMEIGFFDTFLEVKKKIEKYHNIPISKQLLFFNNQLLQDDQIILDTDLTITSTIHLKLKDDQQVSNDSNAYVSMPNNVTPPVQPEISKPENATVTVPMQTETSKPENAPITVPMQTETSKPKNAPITVPMQTETSKPENAPETEPVMPEISKKLSLNVVPMAIRGKDGFLVENIESCAKVSELKQILESYNMYNNVLPEDHRYFFIHKQNVLYEDQSFEWNCIKDGDTIELFDGQVGNVGMAP